MFSFWKAPALEPEAVGIPVTELALSSLDSSSKMRVLYKAASYPVDSHKFDGARCDNYDCGTSDVSFAQASGSGGV